ncbi:MAG TPA: glycosyltransferase family 4 protein [Rariglobus sp.]|jgi:glycosyltransferase involved in cell wall biosynthesis|nr:glycosyltransferase family 4 protein [Rariglobus sp.]
MDSFLIVIVWGKWGPYHFSRYRAFEDHAKTRRSRVIGVQYSDCSNDYAWKSIDNISGTGSLNLKLASTETSFNVKRILWIWTLFLLRNRPDVVVLPSYWNWSLLMNVIARCLGARTVMMNESHAGTARAAGLMQVIKRQILRLFDAALVGGSPHQRHFSGLGMKKERIFIGYDTIDNKYFSEAVEKVRLSAEHTRARHGLPGRYILSIGRMVPKKNLESLVLAYAQLLRIVPEAPALVFVGSGETEAALLALSRKMGLKVVQHLPDSEMRDAATQLKKPDGDAGYVYFHGFRQIDETPDFYALADCFVLPSIQEEWGLVVNEAMACGLPVIVSKTAGCAEDLVEDGGNGFTFDPTKVEELVEALAAIISNQDLRERMGRRSSEIINKWGCDYFARQAFNAAMTACAV